MQLFLQKYMYIINNQMFITFSPNPNYSIVWDVIKNKIPELYTQIQEVIEKQ